jgi:hypothetical protein
MTLGVALAIALHVWGAPNCGQAHTEWERMPDPGVYGRAVYFSNGRNRDCAIVLNTTNKLWREPLESEMLCTIIVHEMGHLTGHNHSDDWRNVMYPHTTHTYWRCATDKPNYGFGLRWYRTVQPAAWAPRRH